MTTGQLALSAKNKIVSGPVPRKVCPSCRRIIG
jgi:hypothetical protein